MQTCTAYRRITPMSVRDQVQLILRMKAKKILYITQEMVPYVSESQMSTVGRELPQRIQEGGREIRTFMPKWGNINERRNQLHEVIRLSGMNIAIDETDHPLIIKVASIQAARLQVYFIDNDDYFYKRLMRTDEDGTEYADNAERAIFYARGVLETVKKLRWVPDVIHCHGWISSIVPFYIKKAFREEPPFAETKVVYSAYEDTLTLAPRDNFPACVDFREAKKNAAGRHRHRLFLALFARSARRTLCRRRGATRIVQCGGRTCPRTRHPRARTLERGRRCGSVCRILRANRGQRRRIKASHGG